MGDNKNKKDYRDRSKIDLNDPNEVAYVLRAWAIEKEQLTEAAEATKSRSRKKIYEFIFKDKKYSKP